MKSALSLVGSSFIKRLAVKGALILSAIGAVLFGGSLILAMRTAGSISLGYGSKIPTNSKMYFDDRKVVVSDGSYAAVFYSSGQGRSVMLAEQIAQEQERLGWDIVEQQLDEAYAECKDKNLQEFGKAYFSRLFVEVYTLLSADSPELSSEKYATVFCKYLEPCLSDFEEGKYLGTTWTEAEGATSQTFLSRPLSDREDLFCAGLYIPEVSADTSSTEVSFRPVSVHALILQGYIAIVRQPEVKSLNKDLGDALAGSIMSIASKEFKDYFAQGLSK